MALCRFWCGECYAYRKGRSDRGCRGSGRGPRKGFRYGEASMGMLKRRVVPEARGVQGVPDAGAFGETYPAIHELLTLASWPDGEARVLGAVRLVYEDGVAKVGLYDNDAGLYCFVSGDGFDAALESAERHLREGTGDWRKAANRPQGRGRKGS